jgi:hypothetical protein
MKKCNKCNEEKELVCFDFRNREKRHSNICKVCRRKQQNAFHKLHPQTNTYIYNPKGYLIIKRNREKWAKKYGVTVSSIAHHSLKIARLVFDKFDRKCNRCGSTEHLAIHHIDGKGRNYTNKKMKPNNNIDNLELLCIRCHGSLHGKIGGKMHGKRKKPSSA